MDRKTDFRIAGFALVEALVALLIVAGGMLGLEQLQVLLVRNNDLAAQRTEATQLARECLESLRSLRNMTDWSGLPGKRCPSPVAGRSASYARAVTLNGSTGDAMRQAGVTVSWTDREGAAQSVTLSSYLAKTYPADSGMLAFRLAEALQLKRPKDRNVNIPIGALDLGNGMSSIQLGASDAVILDNLSGALARRCNPGIANATATLIRGLVDAGSCSLLQGHLMAGYIGRGSSVGNTEWSDIQAGLGINTGGTDGSATGISCQVGSTGDSAYKWYLCVIPLSAPSQWSAKVSGPDALRTGSFFVCRYQYLESSLQAFERNVQPYANVSQSFDQQNYLIATGNASATCPTAMNVTDVSTGVLHQDCRAGNANRATDCPPPS